MGKSVAWAQWSKKIKYLWESPVQLELEMQLGSLCGGYEYQGTFISNSIEIGEPLKVFKQMGCMVRIVFLYIWMINLTECVEWVE